MNDEVSANAILKRATKHYTVIPITTTERFGQNGSTILVGHMESIIDSKRTMSTGISLRRSNREEPFSNSARSTNMLWSNNGFL